MSTTTTMTGTQNMLQSFKASAKNCADADCPHLETEDIVAGDRIRKRKICGLTGRIPGNQECPLEVDN